MTTKKIIIDTDPGIDDAMAICFALSHPELELLGLTTVFGNVSVEQATTNALYISELSEQNIPVAKGAAAPLYQALKPYPDFVHGKDGFGNSNVPAPKGKALEVSAAQFIVNTVMNNPGEVTLIAVGPLTNLALALALEPRIAEAVQQVVLMGGTVLEPGNVSPVAEANIYGDSHAADKVFTAPWSVVMVGLDVTHKVLMSDALQARVRESNARYGQFLYDAGKFYAAFYSAHRGAEGCYVHDGSAVAYTIDPSLFEVEYGAVRVATDGFALGQTIMKRTAYTYPETHWDGQPEVGVCFGVDDTRLLELYENTLRMQ